MQNVLPLRPDAAGEDTPDNAEEKPGLDCFVSLNRPCNASCMAYSVHVTNPSPNLSTQQNHCLALVSAERVGRFLGGLLTHATRKKADDDRTQVTPPPNPRGNA